MNNRYFTLQGEAKELYFKIPNVFLMEDSKYMKMSATSKLLYGILWQRTSLSILNGWVDDEKKVYFYFKQDEIGKLINVKDPKTVRKYLKELEKFDLLDRVNQGLNLPDRLYLKHAEVSEMQLYQLMGKYSLSGQGNIPYPEGEKFPTNKKENNNNLNIYSRVEENTSLPLEKDKTEMLQCNTEVTKCNTEKEKEKEKDINNIYSDVINYLNFKASKNFRPNTTKTKSLIDARTNEGFTLEDFKTVIDVKCSSWLGTDYEKFLRPETLFSNKFEGYLNEKPKKTVKPTTNKATVIVDDDYINKVEGF